MNHFIFGYDHIPEMGTPVIRWYASPPTSFSIHFSSRSARPSDQTIEFISGWRLRSTGMKVPRWLEIPRDLMLRGPTPLLATAVRRASQTRPHISSTSCSTQPGDG